MISRPGNGGGNGGQTGNGPGLNILVVENDEQVRILLHDMLAEHGHRVVSTDTCTEARDLLLDNGIDLMITDVVLCDGGGDDLASVAKELGRRVLIITGSGDAMQALDAKGIDYLAKPFHMDALLDALERSM